jgi:hypothetical protein
MRQGPSQPAFAQCFRVCLELAAVCALGSTRNPGESFIGTVFVPLKRRATVSQRAITGIAGKEEMS